MDKRSAERYREILLERATMNGIQKGRLEERVETAREGIKIGLDIKTIKKLTKLSEEEIRNILKESGKK
jgi:ribosome-interacting GTPase 1